jgi:hypothetical protein
LQLKSMISLTRRPLMTIHLKLLEVILDHMGTFGCPHFCVLFPTKLYLLLNEKRINQYQLWWHNAFGIIALEPT